MPEITDNRPITDVKDLPTPILADRVNTYYDFVGRFGMGCFNDEGLRYFNDLKAEWVRRRVEIPPFIA
jgi:hypothetical protein